MQAVIDQLLASDEPSIRFKVRVGVLGEDPGSPALRGLRCEIRRSPRVRALLADRDEQGRVGPARQPYRKWSGAHWVFAAVGLGLLDGRCHRLARLLLRWQWPDGGWNCDRRPEAVTSSFWESLIPLRGLAAYARATGDEAVKWSAARAAEVFLMRRLFRRARDGGVMQAEFTRLHYPCYWRYDVLFGLKVMAEAGFVGDPRCDDALDLLAAKRLPDGGWPAEERFYQSSRPGSSGYDLVSWGGVSRRRLNEWVTADALYVLRCAGRLDTTAGQGRVAAGRTTGEGAVPDEHPEGSP